VRLSGAKLARNGNLTASVTVKNTGDRAGEAVLQLYLQDVMASTVRPAKELKDFRKVMLAPGESRVIDFPIGEDKLRFYNAKLEYVAEPGAFAGRGGRRLRAGSAIAVQQVVQHFVERRLGVFQRLERGVEGLQGDLRWLAAALRRILALQRGEGHLHLARAIDHAFHGLRLLGAFLFVTHATAPRHIVQELAGPLPGPTPHCLKFG
jgi:Fibronectin type III-like domain